jgi:hypothetical protein
MPRATPLASIESPDQKRRIGSIGPSNRSPMRFYGAAATASATDSGRVDVEGGQ